METPKIKVKYRTTSGKGPARRLRAAGLAPAVIYGRTVENSVPVVVPPRDLTKALANPFRLNTVLDLVIEDAPKGVPAEIKAMVRDHQFEPVSRELLHVDFVALDMDQKVRVKVPLKLTGKAVGVTIGGKLSAFFRELPIECLPSDIPEILEADVTPLNVNQSLTIGDIKLDEKITVTMPANIKIAAVGAAKGAAEEAEEGAGQGAEGGEEAASAE